MRRFFSRRYKKTLSSESDDQDHTQESNLNSTHQPTPNTVIPNDNSVQQDNNTILNENPNDNDSQNNNTHSVDNDITNINNNINDHESQQTRPTIKRSVTEPVRSHTFYYTIKEGDTLEIISEKYNIKESIIKKANRIDSSSTLHEGDVIQLFAEDDTQKFTPIDVFVYDAKSQTDVFPGKLIIKKHNLVFSKKALFHHHHHIDLCGYLESSILPHPSQNLNGSTDSILVINYLKVPDDRTTSITEYFSGLKEDLEKINFEIIKTAEFHQEKANYKPPNPNSINYSQEFADNAGIQKVKRRKSYFGRNKKKDEQKDENPATVQTMKIFLPQIQFLNGQLDILKKTDVFLVRKKLPSRYQNSNWTRLYKSSEDGFLLKTFFKKVEHKRPLLLFVKTFDNDLIGAFIPSGLSVSNSFYGTIETFVFRFKTEIPQHSIFITKLADPVDQISPEKNDNDQINAENKNDNNDQISPEKNDNDQINAENKNDDDGQISPENNDNDQINAENENNNDDQINSEKEDKNCNSNPENNDQNDELNSANNDMSNSEEINKKEEEINSENNDQNEDQINSEISNTELANSNEEMTDQKDDQISEIADQKDDQISEANDQEDDQINIENKNEDEHSILVPNNQNDAQTNDQQIGSLNTQPNENKPHQKERTVLEVFRWNKLQCLDNRNFVLSNYDSILFGGGKSSSIYIDKEMYKGYSDPCDTFCSPRLTKKKRFDIAVIEVWEVS